MNLFVNASDAIEEHIFKNEGTPSSLNYHKIEISSQLSAEGIEIKVKDTGPGIPDSVREKIFDPFFSTKSVGKGTGLGLHIVRNEIKKFGGDIFVENEKYPEQGTIFTIKLPKAYSKNKGVKVA